MLGLPVNLGFGPTNFEHEEVVLGTPTAVDLPIKVTDPKTGDVLIYNQQEQSWTNEPSTKLVDGGNF